MAIFSNFESLTGNPRLNINTTTAKGLEKVIGKVAGFIIRAQTSTNSVLYGKNELQGRKDVTKIQKALDRGLLKLVEELSNIDFCGLFSYAANQVNLGKSFDPSGPPEGADTFEIRKWNLQKKFFDIQTKIDNYYGLYGTLSGQDSRQGLLELLKLLSVDLKTLTEINGSLRDPLLIKSFPEITTATNYLDNVYLKISTYTNSGNIPISEVQTIIKAIDKIKFFSTAILSLNRPGNLIAFGDSITGGAIQREFAKLNKIVTPGPETIRLIKNILEKAEKINSVARTILSYINLIRSLIKLALLLLKVFFLIRKFLFGLPLPAAFTPVGANVVLADISETVVKEKGINKLVDRLNQINAVLNLMAIFVTSLVAAMTTIIQTLSQILLNIEGCNPDLAKQIKNTIDNLNNTRAPLQKFLDDYNGARNRIDKTFGGYTIDIVTEQVTDEGISLKRRYGIARGADNIIAVQSTPTFASLDLIIINEVKVLLVSKGLVKTGLPSISSEDAVTIMDAMNYLGDESDVDFDVNTVGAITETFKDVDDEIGLNSFINNLPGGKALRKKVRKKLITNNQKLVADLKATDPNSTYSKNIIKEKENETNKLKIEKLEEEKSALQKSLLLTASNPLGAAAIIAKIKDIDNQIKDLKNNLK